MALCQANVTSPPVQCSLRGFRVAHELSQAQLAQRVGLSRQALSAIEAGTAVPGTDVALRLARELGVPVESLFQLAGGATQVEATLATATLATATLATPGGEARAGVSGRVLLAEVDGRWIAHPMSASDRESLSRAADGLATTRLARRSKTVRVEPLGDLEAARERLLVMGCAPALGLLAARLGAAPTGVRVSWIRGQSMAALEALRRSEVHVAGIHLLDEASGQYNAPIVRAQLPGRGMLLINLASWEQGILVAAGNPLKLRTAADLVRPKVRFVAREAGAGAQKLLTRALRGEGARVSDMRRPTRVASGHMEVAEAIALGTADAGIAIRSAALAYGLDFLPLAEERFDLVIPRGLATDARVERLVDMLGSRAFRRELEAVGGYSTALSGQRVGAARATE